MLVKTYNNTLIVSALVGGLLGAGTRCSTHAKVQFKKDNSEAIAQRAAYLALEQVCSDLGTDEEEEEEDSED